MGSMKFLTLPDFVFGFLLLLLCGCAQISSPTGGPIDEDPPHVLKMSPASDQVNARPTSLRILFDEFVALKNPQQQLVISPPISTKPTFRIKGKEVRIELDPASFQDSTTYVFSFGKGIVDLHESNPAEGLNLGFFDGFRHRLTRLERPGSGSHDGRAKGRTSRLAFSRAGGTGFHLERGVA